MFTVFMGNNENDILYNYAVKHGEKKEASLEEYLDGTMSKHSKKRARVMKRKLVPHPEDKEMEDTDDMNTGLKQKYNMVPNYSVAMNPYDVLPKLGLPAPKTKGRKTDLPPITLNNLRVLRGERQKELP